MVYTVMNVIKKDTTIPVGAHNAIVDLPITAAVASKVYAATVDMQFSNDGDTRLYVFNQSSAAAVITIDAPATTINNLAYVATQGITRSIPASKLASEGPFNTGINQSGLINFHTGGPANVYLAAISGKV